jgi:hypothetical protein
VVASRGDDLRQQHVALVEEVMALREQVTRLADQLEELRRAVGI